MPGIDRNTDRSSCVHDDDVGAEAALLIFERVLPAVAANVGRIRADLATTLASYGVRRDRRADITLVATEAATNAVLHAYSDTAPGPLYVAAALDGDTLTICVGDGGHGMRPRPDSPGLGLGMALMSRLADELRISPGVDTRGTCLTAFFNGATSNRPRLPGPSTPAADRADVLRGYVDALRAVHGRLAEETDAVLAEAAQAVAQGRAQLRSRRARRAADGRTGI